MGAQLVSDSATVSHDDASCVDALWLATLHRICSRAAHEVKGALNGVSVNLEVVRSRADKPEAPASAVRQYAESAAMQLDDVITMTDALLALGRPAREPVEIVATVHRLGALLVPAAKADGRRLEIDASLDTVGTTSAPGSIVRLAIGAVLLRAIDASAHVRCLSASNGAPAMRVESCDGASLAADDAIVAAAASAGITIQAEPSAIFISFPR